MECEVIVVGGGIGGLTVAALLAARGVDVALFERQSHVGGCLAKFEHLGQSFDPTFGLFSGWEPDGVWERVFDALPVTPPEATKLTENFVLRLPDGVEVPVGSDRDALQQSVARAFPDCADKAVQFMRAIFDSRADLDSLRNTSVSFRAFIDAQLSFLAQRTLESAEPSHVIDTLSLATGDMWEIDGGAHSLADRLASSFKQSGGSLRLNSPVLRLAYRSSGAPEGVDLLSGERVTATRAIVSNLTVWDTYGKLIGLRYTPAKLSAQLRQMSAWGVYQVFMVLDEDAVARLPCSRLVLVVDSEDTPAPAPHLMLNIATGKNQSTSSRQRAATLTSFTNTDDWFAFHQDASWHDEQDQAALEEIWSRLHRAAPEIASGAEVFETTTPQTLYESVRRKMGMVGSPTPAWADRSSCFDNLFLIGDTVSDYIGVAGVAKAAYHLAETLRK
ncbi:MAG TPA: FAD-dependent oxidoreductase [Pyrinomonadaceae bacterium]|nr:FAD-dependent oxidoreductase [Pyrinomonadaceae bacterium]